MKVNLREFDEFPAMARLEAGPESFKPFSEDVVSVSNVTVDLAIQKAEEEYYCQGEVEADVTIECARCLRPFEAHLHGRTDFIINERGGKPSERDDVFDDEEYIALEPSTMTADISEPVHEALVLAMEMKPLCQEDCKGLCPNCGANWNEETCDCRKDDIDERWEGLQGLLGR